MGSALGDGDYVPDVEGDYVDDEEIDVAGGVDGASFADGVGGAGFVGLGADGFGAFDLNAPETLAVVEDEIVTETVAQDLATPNPRPEARCRKAASERSPVCLVLGRRGGGRFLRLRDDLLREGAPMAVPLSSDGKRNGAVPISACAIRFVYLYPE